MGVLTVKVSSNGKVMDPAYQLMSVDITKELNRVPYTQLVLLDGSIAKKTFPISDEAFFLPGQPIEIELSYEGEPASKVKVFEGIIVRHSVEASSYGSTLTVEIKDNAVKLTQTRKSAVYTNKTDDKICGDLVTAAGLKKLGFSRTEATHKEIVQYNCTDWDFILSRAASNGLLVSAENGAISIVKPALNKKPVATFEYGISEIYDFEITVNAEHQYASVESTGWDAKKHTATKPTKGKDVTLTPGNVNAKDLAKKIGGTKVGLTSAVPLDAKELEAWSNAAVIRSRLGLVRGRVSVPGFGKIKPLDVVQISGIGKRFNGKTLVTGVRHRISTAGWRTDVQFGMSPEPFAHKANIVEPPAAGLLPAVNGLQIGIVDKFQADPDNEVRVRVKLPALGASAQPIWARLATPEAGSERGFFFFPETGDEVVVGFFNSDPRQAVILGAMFGSKNKVPKDLGDPTKENKLKAIVTKTGSKVGFIDEKKGAIFIETAAGNTVLVDDDAKSVMLKDEHGNTVLMNKDGIEIKSAKDIILDASGNVEIKGTKVNVK
jgi:Rhs element Vgr protein